MSTERPGGWRQEYALELIRHHASLTALELGWRLHQERGARRRGAPCPACDTAAASDEGCGWAEQDGRQVLASLRRRGLVVRRPSGRWELRDQRSKDRGSLSQDRDGWGGFGEV